MEALTKASQELATMKWGIVQLGHEVDKRKILITIYYYRGGKGKKCYLVQVSTGVMYGVIRIVFYTVYIRH